jgi:cyclic pyranopterin phosphate synthase
MQSAAGRLGWSPRSVRGMMGAHEKRRDRLPGAGPATHMMHAMNAEPVFAPGLETRMKDTLNLHPQAPGLIDPFGRRVSYLRVSVTDRCDFRCSYCMSEHMTFLPKRDLLTLEELDRLCSAFVAKGVSKLRITGGEPLMRKNIMWLFRALSRHLAGGALEELTLTTNGSQLVRFAGELEAAGVRRVNISLDTLVPARFKAITRWGDLAQVMAGIDAAEKAGLAIKLNAVALKGVNEDEFDDLIRFAHGRGFDLTLIETMPMGDIDVDRTDQYLPLSIVRARLLDRWTLEDIPFRTGGPARYVRVRETGGKLGFITPMTHNFCESCNRVRLTCTGTLYMCLGQNDAADLRTPLRAAPDDGPLLAAIDEAISRKPKGHDFVIDRRSRQPAVARHMSVTGG